MIGINKLEVINMENIHHKKILFISSKDVTKKSHGGFICTNRNYLSFCEIFGILNIEVLNLSLELKETLKSRLKKWGNYLLGFWPGLSNSVLKKILDKAIYYDFVFIDTSQFGIISYYLKKNNYQGKIFCFFHNVEYNIWMQKLKVNPLNFWRLLLIYYNEKKAIQNADKVIALNKRDSLELKRIYGNRKITIIPISLIDTTELCENQIKKYSSIYTSSIPTLLFIGNHWYPNIHGLTWFVKNVLSKVNIKLQIVGNEMDSLKDDFLHPKIEFLGYVPNLSEVIANADFMITPLFKGSGMKIKTCEALMYGKNIIGTKEAFEGYEVDYEEVGALCSNKEEFILKITELTIEKRKKFNETSRKIFLTHYSFEATLRSFKDLIEFK